MKLARLDILVYCLVFTTIGALGGFVASREKSAPAGAHEDEDEHAAHADEGPTFSPQTLANLGVTTATIAPTTFVKRRSIPATIERTPFNERPVFAPIGGRVLEIRAEPGTVAAAGATLLTLVRDPIPRPTLPLTEGIVKPAHEEVHRSVSSLRTALAELEITRTELERVTRFSGEAKGDELPILPRQTIIDLRYKQARIENEVDRARLELVKHGFSDEQIDAVAGGAAIPVLGRENWLRALVANGLWTPAAEKLFAALPESMREQRLTVATVAELAAADLVRDGFVSLVADLGEDCEHFLELSALLQQGYSVEDLGLLHALHALDPIVTIEAPGAGEVPDWNVESIDIRPGSRVEAGTKLLTLLDPRLMYLRTEPVGAEKADVLRAVAEGALCEAVPMVRDSGPEIDGIRIDFVTAAAAGQGTVAYARVRNEELGSREQPDGRRFRSFRLRGGLKYLLRVPTTTIADVFVLPTAAVASDGPARVVFIPDGETFRSIEVEIAYQDEEVAVIPIAAETLLFPGDRVVISGAYALSLALRTQAGAADAHAGHNH